MDAIEITRAAEHLGSAVVSDRPAYAEVTRQLRGLLVAKSRLEMYHPQSKEYGENKDKYEALVSWGMGGEGWTG